MSDYNNTDELCDYIYDMDITASQETRILSDNAPVPATTSTATLLPDPGTSVVTTTPVVATVTTTQSGPSISIPTSVTNSVTSNTTPATHERRTHTLRPSRFCDVCQKFGHKRSNCRVLKRTQMRQTARMSTGGRRRCFRCGRSTIFNTICEFCCRCGL